MEITSHARSIWRINKILLCVLQVAVAQADFVWKTGSWGDCRGSDSHCGLHNSNLQTRAVWCENYSNGVTAQDANCDSLKPHKERTCFKVCPQHHHMFEWTLGSWDPCEIQDDQNEGSTSAILECGPASLGKKHRTVSCNEKGSHFIQRLGEVSIADSICEIFWQKPSIVRDCLVNCSQNCVVSQYGKWSDCTQACGNATKTRLRRVLVPNNEHGEPCPTLSETIPCAGLPLCPFSENFVYTLKVDPWSNCLVSGDVTDGFPPVGSMSRDLHCVRNDGEIVDISFCIDEYMPERSKPCVPPVDCVLSEWSLWSPCPNVCHLPYGSLPDDVQTYRTRTVTQVPWGRGQLCEELVQYQSCSDVDSTLFPDQAGLDCQREEYVWFASEWSPCQSQESNSATCGAGVQTRDVFCIRVSDAEHLPMPSNLCDISLLPDTIQQCAVHCPVDCIVSSWGPWDHCRANECDQLGVKKAKGYRTRERSVIVGESHGGEACPHLYEHAPCTATECYSWKVGRVGKCRPTNVEQNCGDGLLTQDIQCLNFNQQPVESKWCESIAEMPEWEEPCYHPCPDDCVTSDWGNWSPCSLTCTGKNQGGMQVRYKRILAQPERGGRPCPPESELRDTRPCNDHSCALFAWQTEQWGVCILDTSVLLQGCGRGTQQRRVKCDRVMPRKDAPEQRCKPEVKPAGRRSCTVPCPVPCRTSQFTAWSECPTQCYGSGSTLFTQVRSRYILQHPQNTAQSCPSGFHEERVCAGPESCHTYKWVVSSWSSECQIGNNRGPGITCGDGLYTREVQCYRGDDQPVDIDLCLKYGPIQPPTTKPCNIPCEDDCQFNPWSLWSQCLNCDSKQTRTRTLHVASRQNKKCTNKVLYPTTENMACTCPVFRPRFIGSQSECIISELDESLETGVSGMEMDCGRGYQYQAVQCMDGNDVVVPLSYCGEDAAVKKQPCGLPCPTDCQISEWSPWSPCESDNGTKQGRQTRRRELMPPQFGGRPCPLETGDSLFEVQTRPCWTNSDYDLVRWHAGDWGECLVRSLSPGASPCGVGMRQRDVSCLKIDEGGFTTIANSSLCPSESTPALREVCSKPCFGQCVVSQWTEWSACPKNCSSLFFRKRYRDILRHASQDIEDCPYLTESQPCRINLNCFQYFWNASGWSSCMLGENAECGHGRKTRLLTCASVTGALVDNQLCEKFAFNAMPEITHVCSVECPLDCKMSVWSEWSTCPQTCGTHRLQTRSRTIIQNPNERGRPCPSSLVQSRPCEAVPCYTFRHSDWGPCTAQGECGSGLRDRNVTCHQPEGQQVDFDLCLKFRSSLYHSNMNISQRGHELLQTVEECQVPCPGECQRGDWSQWSDCNIHCSDGRHLDTHGSQVRSRASLTLREDCPGDEVETRTCGGTVCYEFTWKTDEWNLGSRNVWCERSDGMVVTGGCSEKLKPNVNAVCSKGCPVQNSFCSENELCSCMKKFKPMYSQESGMLAECVDAKWKESKDLISVISTKSPDMTKDSNAGQLGDDMFGFDFLTLLVLGTAAIVIIVMIFIVCAICCCCTKKKTSKKSDDKLPQPQYRDYQNSFWDESAKMKYTGEIDL